MFYVLFSEIFLKSALDIEVASISRVLDRKATETVSKYKEDKDSLNTKATLINHQLQRANQ